MNNTTLFGDLDLVITDQSSIIGGVWVSGGTYVLEDNNFFEVIYKDIISHIPLEKFSI